MRSQEELCMDLLAFENLLLNTLASNTQETHLGRLHTAAERVRCAILDSDEQGKLAPTTRHLGARVGQRLERLAQLLRAEQHEVNMMRTTTRNELRELLQNSSIARESSDSIQDKGDASLNAGKMRAWFLKNLGYPFPTRSAKKSILAETNAEARDNSECLVYNQAVLWFINTRRRSGWTTFLRSYAKGDKAMLLEIAWALQHEQGGTHEQRCWSAGPRTVDGVTRQLMCSQARQNTFTLRDLFPEASERFLNELRSDWVQIVERIKVGAKDKIGDWVNDVIRLSETLPSSRPSSSNAGETHIWRTCPEVTSRTRDS
ncbi:hypothetical protein MYAM1_000916 [Malassezia yamatoensis]|uniref:KN homeodomain domain-containing protein n=1 Tax=Malassezia yamatoensis TaxID=253288 RepID=A0AAJ5YR24_9BASI|nr:hypothetical protein MYAM1_000916 [Malassezia yamatoensis]